MVRRGYLRLILFVVYGLISGAIGGAIGISLIDKDKLDGINTLIYFCTSIPIGLAIFALFNVADIIIFKKIDAKKVKKDVEN